MHQLYGISHWPFQSKMSHYYLHQGSSVFARVRLLVGWLVWLVCQQDCPQFSMRPRHGRDRVILDLVCVSTGCATALFCSVPETALRSATKHPVLIWAPQHKVGNINNTHT